MHVAPDASRNNGTVDDTALLQNKLGRGSLQASCNLQVQAGEFEKNGFESAELDPGRFYKHKEIETLIIVEAKKLETQ